MNGINLHGVVVLLDGGANYSESDYKHECLHTLKRQPAALSCWRELMTHTDKRSVQVYQGFGYGGLHDLQLDALPFKISGGRCSERG